VSSGERVNQVEALANDLTSHAPEHGKDADVTGRHHRDRQESERRDDHQRREEAQASGAKLLYPHTLFHLPLPSASAIVEKSID
jgi:hypothetical protein